MKNVFFTSLSAKSIVLFLGLFMFSGISVQAATINWIGGNGFWQDGSNWSTGQEPGNGDHVIIDSGTAEISSAVIVNIRSLAIGESGTLTILGGATINIHGAVGRSAIKNEGVINNYGRIECQDVLRMWVHNAGHGIYNSGTVYNDANAAIEIGDVETNGIENAVGAYFYNYGTVEMFEVGAKCIRNSFVFYNHKYIVLDNLNQPTQAGIINTRIFQNFSAGQIIIYGGDTGISNSMDGKFYNRGDLILKDQIFHGILNSQKFYNYKYGVIDISDSGETALVNSYRFDNRGTLIVNDGGASGIGNTGEFLNTKTISIANVAAVGISNWQNAEFSNEGKIDITNTGNVSINNLSEIENTPEGAIEIDGPMTLVGDVLNHGIFTTTYNGNGQAGFNFYNYGVVEDPNDNFISNPVNEELYLKPFTGTLQYGIPYPDFLRINNGDMVEYHGIYYNEEATKEAGKYDWKSNTFEPNEHAIGQSQLYVVVSIMGTNNYKICSLPMWYPIQPYVTPTGHDFAGDFADLAAANNSNSMQVFPNPTTGEINLQSELFDKENTSVEIYNAIGQKVYAEQFDQYARPNFYMPENLTSGMYFIRCLQADKNVATQRIQLQR